MRAVPVRSGTVKASTAVAAIGIAIQMRYGRKCPQRVTVRSATVPMIGSKNASATRVTSIIVPMVAAPSRNTSV